ncbi:Uncharacterised protein [Streptococcus pneumoniae]|nr:Uncharacterised protein [Streptococcus pneumoniae]CKF02926.1 Uncharacterised protein [Bacillus paranthracis]CKE89423.1 Uncharacterised protein [Streptococcus pneumoniae]CKF11008.1 Uncharacterised protein [Streptococcus pneumoniae]CKF15089.1 Uncharacterised protein [Streptococcus pneumoniae]
MKDYVKIFMITYAATVLGNITSSLVLTVM